MTAPAPQSAGRHRPGMSRVRGLPLPASRRAGADKSAGADRLGLVRGFPVAVHQPPTRFPVRASKRSTGASSQTARGRVYGPASHSFAGG